jgi:hypothetical protein
MRHPLPVRSFAWTMTPNARILNPSLKPSKQQLFKSHPSHLPMGGLLPIHYQPALALVTEGRVHLKHGIAFLISH